MPNLFSACRRYFRLLPECWLRAVPASAGVALRWAFCWISSLPVSPSADATLCDMDRFLLRFVRRHGSFSERLKVGGRLYGVTAKKRKEGSGVGRYIMVRSVREPRRMCMRYSVTKHFSFVKKLFLVVRRQRSLDFGGQFTTGGNSQCYIYIATEIGTKI